MSTCYFPALGMLGPKPQSLLRFREGCVVEGASAVGLEGYVGAEVMPLGQRGSRGLPCLSFRIISPESASTAQERCDLHSEGPQ